MRHSIGYIAGVNVSLCVCVWGAGGGGVFLCTMSTYNYNLKAQATYLVFGLNTPLRVHVEYYWAS